MPGLNAFGEDTRSLLARISNGDQSAIDRLFAIHSDRLLRAVRLRMPSELRPWIEHEDICQQSLVKALQGIDSFEYRGEGTFLAWLVRIADHSIRDALRAAARKGTRPAEGNLAPHSETPSRLATQREDLALLERGIDSLTNSDRELIIDREILGADLGELAERLGKRPETVRVALHRAKARLAHWFERHS